MKNPSESNQRELTSDEKPYAEVIELLDFLNSLPDRTDRSGRIVQNLRGKGRDVLAGPVTVEDIRQGELDRFSAECKHIIDELNQFFKPGISFKDAFQDLNKANRILNEIEALHRFFLRMAPAINEISNKSEDRNVKTAIKKGMADVTSSIGRCERMLQGKEDYSDQGAQKLLDDVSELKINITAVLPPKAELSQGEIQIEDIEKGELILFLREVERIGNRIEGYFERCAEVKDTGAGIQANHNIQSELKDLLNYFNRLAPILSDIANQAEPQIQSKVKENIKKTRTVVRINTKMMIGDFEYKKDKVGKMISLAERLVADVQQILNSSYTDGLDEK